MNISGNIKENLPTTLTATYKIITPMFIGDAEQNASWISPMSFKGALRFWWRALAWGRIRAEKENDEEALKALHHQEALLFGSSADNPDKKNKKNAPKTYGRGTIKIQVIADELTASDKQLKGKVHDKLKNYTASKYLGYGVINYHGELERDCINEGKTFKVKVIVDNSAEIENLKDALILMGLLGGLGSKARKGYGSINLVKLEGKGINWQSPKDFDDYKYMLKALVEVPKDMKKVKTLPPFSAFSDETLIVKLFEKNCPYKVLGFYGKAMIEYRSWGQRGKIAKFDENGTQQKEYDEEKKKMRNSFVKSQKSFKDDHDWSKDTGSYPNFHPERVVFGLPHNYGKKPTVGRGLLNNKEGRRASPLFFHVQEIEGKYYGIATLLKAEFLPANEKIKAGGNQVSQNIKWEVLKENFLQDKKRFPNANPLFPEEAQQ
ncbi:type III-B CRISPR module RAMP protein Cmr1 [Pasteurella skyensis]|uniref:Type III-B CRISPR module RAMP protein Cmr1 n=1 Tax=Phocoenobacter skyensis TaxID=97481 RepID=A0AAJ6N7R7_9PAST|nr:type III-B CRISPR module RAMP protein Cmr1 [Pasteurella skyensis]MDP8161610.1 type III-B CRISPR module RAMP protein Cmr1 [Pasteurella skyensis]MDP8171766.1 type III-B CRISPR module RAMP protein Cmr1 [Pasteurella skyensis]MDP8176004.1 type III-B CRISPR module RAMP protein Cmr1 [Pasteurella skyensis]MDP8177972.1 type III-B CRISPR module RAMP protein Cmr1 [Pasteurella skyensis]MDP8182369.1 type III-B CRISPR module RAMP protein Cmr1 [Pasteurella skyensis]